MKSDPEPKGVTPARVVTSLEKWGMPLAAWVVCFLLIALLPGLSSLIPIPLLVAVPVIISGANLGIWGGLSGALLGLPLTTYAHDVLSPAQPALEAIRLVLMLAGYGVIGFVAGNLHNVRRKLNLELKKSQQENRLRESIQKALQESEKNYRELFELESDAIFIIQNTDGRILEVNPAACIMYGYSREEMLELKNTDMSAEPEETRERTQQTHPPTHVVRIPLRWHRKKDGAIFPVDITARFIVWKNRSVHIAAIRDITEWVKAEQELERLATTDPLTGLDNRRQFFKKALVLFERASNPPYALAVLMIDIDHFKNVNDTYGHAMGDIALCEVARRLKLSVRPTDILARYGGEEFVVMLPRTQTCDAEQIAERVCRSISSSPIETNGQPIRVTISMGVAMLDENTVTLDKLLQRADQALYAAKSAGRNRWHHWQPE